VFADLSSGATFWEYDFGDFDGSIQQNPTHTYADTGHYTVQQIVINQYGCADTSEQIVPILAEFTFFVPNAFTPNGNGNNDVFYGSGEGIREFTMLIFDRWGNLIFESHDPSVGWDGTRNGGTLCQIDTYVYRFVIIDVLGEEHKYMGHVNLVR
jgi:gliding motility-associated-like protein